MSEYQMYLSQIMHEGPIYFCNLILMQHLKTLLLAL